ncbi:MAG TPA: hypothetical protein VI792_04405 [Candidatus Eisenbacteria bacterium]
MKRTALILTLLLATVALAATAAPTTKSSTKGGKPYFEATDKVTAQATVVSVNKSNRKVKLTTEAGDTVHVECGPEVKNFAQIAKGDVVKITYTEKLTIHVEPAGGPGTSAEATTATAKEGAKPSMSASAKIQYKASITAIDKEKGTVTLKGDDGREFDVTPRKKENLSKVQVGDLVVFTYSEAVAASVEKVPAAK